jgi:coenzyme F420-0:L-glutamate ligase/coenzyme F420-1:gamma-L-glutamate ligase
VSAYRAVALAGLPEIAHGADLAALIAGAALGEGIALWDASCVVVAQKVVSKAEGRVLRLADITPSPRAAEMARVHGRDPRLMEVILRETKRVVRERPGVLIVETHQGWICANAGVDQSNVPGEDCVTLLPLDADASASRIREKLREITGTKCGVVISDTFGRPWRNGLANVAIGVAGFQALRDERGRPDRQGRPLRGTVLAVADEIAAAAGLLMAKSAGTPVVAFFGLSLNAAPGSSRHLIRPAHEDLFR